MIIRLLNFLFEIDITNERILKFLFCKLSHFTYWDYDTIINISQVSENEIHSKKCDIYGNSKVCYDNNFNRLLFYYSDKDEKLYLEFIILQYIFLILMNNGIFYMHGACLTTNQNVNKGILLLGQSGSGKTSLALKMIGRGEHLVTDDFILLKKRGDKYVAYMNKALPHIFAENLRENFHEYKEYVSMVQESSEYKVDIQIDKKNLGVYKEAITPKYILFISDQYYPICKIERIDLCTIIAYILRGKGNIKQYSYRKYYEFAIDICEQCNNYQLKKIMGIERNVDEIYKVLKIQCNG